MNAAVGFIRSVAAVVVAIASPLFRHAVAIRAPEGRILLAADRSSSGADVGSFVEDASLAAIPLRGISLRRQIPFVVAAWANGADALLLRIRAVISAVLLVLAFFAVFLAIANFIQFYALVTDGAPELVLFAPVSPRTDAIAFISAITAVLIRITDGRKGKTLVGISAFKLILVTSATTCFIGAVATIVMSIAQF